MLVLVVDDELAIAETLCDLLGSAGHRAISAGNGCDGVKAFEAQKPELIVADVMMPQLDGRDMVRVIRSSESGHHVPIILMSAARDVARDTSIGHDLFLAKPFDLDEFLGHVERLGDSGRGRGSDGSLPGPPH